MDILQFLSGTGLFLILAVVLVIVVVWNKFRGRR